jgi:hypothetical protein
MAQTAMSHSHVSSHAGDSVSDSVSGLFRCGLIQALIELFHGVNLQSDAGRRLGVARAAVDRVDFELAAVGASPAPALRTLVTLAVLGAGAGMAEIGEAFTADAEAGALHSSAAGDALLISLVAAGVDDPFSMYAAAVASGAERASASLELAFAAASDPDAEADDAAIAQIERLAITTSLSDMSDAGMSAAMPVVEEPGRHVIVRAGGRLALADYFLGEDRSPPETIAPRLAANAPGGFDYGAAIALLTRVDSPAAYALAAAVILAGDDSDAIGEVTGDWSSIAVAVANKLMRG